MAFGLIFRVLLLSSFFFLPFVEGKRQVENEEAAISPFLLPENHPTKAGLDHIFHSQRALFNIKSLKDAGFIKPKIRSRSKLIVTTHPDFPGYIFKLFMDIQRPYTDSPEYYYWTRRIANANVIRNLIAERNLESEFKVPQKWMYQLPDTPVPPLGYFKKHYLLVVEDMDLYSETENESIWKSDLISEQLLTDLYHLLNDLGLEDCAKPDNIPFSHDGKIAFIDTQFLNRKVNFTRLTKHLSPSNQNYWKSLID